MAGAFAIVALLVCLGAVSAQPFDVEPLPFSPEMAEPQERIQDKYKGFTFDFDEATVSDAFVEHGKPLIGTAKPLPEAPDACVIYTHTVCMKLLACSDAFCTRRWPM